VVLTWPASRGRTPYSAEKCNFDVTPEVPIDRNFDIEIQIDGRALCCVQFLRTSSLLLVI